MKVFVNTFLVLSILAMVAGLGFISKMILDNKDIEDIKEDVQDTIEEIQSAPEEENEPETFFGFIIDYEESDSILTSVEDISLRTDDTYTCYFDYDDMTFTAYYTPDNWTIFDSYRIRNSADMQIICQALIDLHPVHGKDMVSYRTAEDMAYEWLQHNIAYDFLPGDEYREMVKDVDLDPADQGKNLEELVSSRN